MNVFAIDTSGFSASLAGVYEEKWHGTEMGADEKTAQFLIPKIKEFLGSLGCSLGDIDLFAVTSGPGSFTGIRIGMTTLKTIAYALNKRIVGVNSLAAIAQSAKMTGHWMGGSLTVAINAFRQQFFVATFDWDTFETCSTQAHAVTQLVAYDQLCPLLEIQDSMLTGPIEQLVNSEFSRGLGSRHIAFDQIGNTAVGVGQVGLLAVEQGKTDAPISLLPSYFRGSAAEEKLFRN